MGLKTHFWTQVGQESKEKEAVPSESPDQKNQTQGNPNICALILRDQFYKFEKLGNVGREQSGTEHIRPHSVHTLQFPFNPCQTKISRIG